MRLAAFCAIVLAGLAGGVIGYSLVRIQSSGDNGLPLGIGVLVGSSLCAAGMAVVATLVMRAIGEWRELDVPPRR